MNSVQASPDHLLAATPPPVSRRDAEALARDRFGISAAATELASERDRNFHLIADSGGAYVLKVANPVEPAAVTDLQTRALRHVQAANPDLPVPRLVSTLAGSDETRIELADGRTSVVRMVSFLYGEPLHTLPCSAPRQRNLGRCLARLGLALRDFHHPGADHGLLWDIKNAGRLRGLLAQLPDLDHFERITHYLDGFIEYAEPVLPKLRAQIVHNDLNPHNVLMDRADHDRISGIIDFGDIVHTPLINDVAVAASYQVAGQTGTLDGVTAFVSGYHSVVALEPAEVDILYDLIAARLIATLVIGNWRARRYQHNRAYILRNSRSAWAGLERFAQLSRGEARAMLRRACDMEH